MKTLAVFSAKGGVGKTSLVYHLAYMFALRGKNVIAADFDPQANLTGMFLRSERIEALWSQGDGATVPSAMQPLIEGTGDVQPVNPQNVANGLEGTLALLASDFALLGFQDELAVQWQHCLTGEPRAFRVTAAFEHILRSAGTTLSADISLIDIGPSIGAINRCAVIAADFIIVPIRADPLSIRSLHSIGPVLRNWRSEWHDRRERAPAALNFTIPQGEMRPLGYVVTGYPSHRHGAPGDFQKWIGEAAEVYRASLLGEAQSQEARDNCLAQLKDYRSLMPMAQEARKPMFLLKPADGAIGGHQAAVQQCYRDFEALAETIERRIGL